MKIILYSCDNEPKAVYDRYEKKYLEMGYKVINPYDERYFDGDVYGTVMRYIGKANMLVIISPIVKSSDLISLRRYCFNNIILFRNERDENLIHHSWWYGNDKKNKR
jgi:hypothetical protein